jgi:hypothetical protein
LLVVETRDVDLLVFGHLGKEVLSVAIVVNDIEVKDDVDVLEKIVVVGEDGERVLLESSL